MIRFAILITVLLPLSNAFAPQVELKRLATAVEAVSRRDAFVTGASALLVGLGSVPKPSVAFQQQLNEWESEPAQMPTGGKYDLNSAFVGDYKKLRGMFPHAAGKIASNGPYEKVSDIYKIPGLTMNDKKLFKQYEDQFTVNPPGRAFKERINARVST